jgi:hypothetical protein
VVCLECDRDASIMRRPWPTGGCCAMEMGRIQRQWDDQGEILDILMDTDISDAESHGDLLSEGQNSSWYFCGLTHMSHIVH